MSFSSKPNRLFWKLLPFEKSFLKRVPRPSLVFGHFRIGNSVFKPKRFVAWLFRDCNLLKNFHFTKFLLWFHTCGKRRRRALVFDVSAQNDNKNALKLKGSPFVFFRYCEIGNLFKRESSTF